MQKLLLHICCGPCETHVVELLSHLFNVTGFFYNPNIHPQEEYTRRLDAARAVSERAGITLIEGDYNPQVFFDVVRGFEHEPENGKRCSICYRLRLSETARYAADNSYDCIACTLTLGQKKKAALINPIGVSETGRVGLRFIEGDWKKDDGFRKSCELSREYGIYRQNYCGCVFSMRGEATK